MLDDILLLLVIISYLFLWVLAGIRFKKYGGKKGVVSFFKHFIFYIIVGFVLYMLIVFPQWECTGLDCLINTILIYVGLVFMMGLVWPISLLIITKKKFPNGPIKKDEDIIDEVV